MTELLQLPKLRKRTDPMRDPMYNLMGNVRVDSTTGCWIWLAALAGGGYGTVSHNGRQQPAHRVSWELHKGEIPGGLWVLHRCDVRRCINPEHLFLGTRQDNMTDMVQKGRSSHKPSFGRRKLTQEDVAAIRAELACGLPQQFLADKYGVQQAAISKIKLGVSWKD